MMNERPQSPFFERFGHAWSEPVILKNGVQGQVRFARREDVALLDAYYEQIKPDDLYLRFFFASTKKYYTEPTQRKLSKRIE